MTHGKKIAREWLIAFDADPFLTKVQFAAERGYTIKMVQSATVGHNIDFKRVSEYAAERMRECASDLKIEPCDLTWYDFRKWAEIAYGANSKALDPRTFSRCGGFANIRDAHFPRTPTQRQTERARLSEQSTYNRRHGEAFARENYVRETIEQFADRVFRGRVVAQKQHKTATKTKRAIHCVLSDLHFGSDLLSDETSAPAFGRVEEARRMAQIAREVVSYKENHRDETDLVVWLLGDLIQNQLHDQRDGAVISEQVCRAIHVLSQFIAYAANRFSRVTVLCSPGNHGRFTSRHHGRATYQKFDAIETVIAYAVKSALANVSNVTIEIPKTPFASIEKLGARFFGTHGDTVFNPGNPGKSVNAQGLEAQINRINADLRSNGNAAENKVFLCGHVHQPTILHLGNGTSVVINGALVPPDHFAASLGRFASASGQWIFEQCEQFAVGDSRFIRVGVEHDRDASLDDIIKPWSGF